jgi:hypothetical protein
MLDSALSALSGTLDSKFVTAYWLPACVFVLGSLGLLAVRVGPEELATELIDLDTVEQGLSVVIILVLITILAFIVRALTLPIAEIFAGRALPPAIAAWSTRGQLRRKARTDQRIQSNADTETSTVRLATLRQRVYFPVHDTDVQPTGFSNVLAAAGERAWDAYAMDVAVWWPRLEPFLPDAFLDGLASAQASMVGMLNFSVAFAALTPVAVVVLGPAGLLWGAAIAVVVTLLLSRLCYGAAVSQAAEVGVRVNAAFDLYRSALLTQLEQGRTGELATERARWRQMAGDMLGLPVPTPEAGALPEARADVSATAAELAPSDAHRSGRPRRTSTPPAQTRSDQGSSDSPYLRETHHG